MCAIASSLGHSRREYVDVIARNRTALFTWGLTAVYTTLVAMIPYLLWRDGLPPGDSVGKVVTFVVLFVCGALVLVWLSCRSYTTTVVKLDRDRIRVTVRYPHKRVSAEIALTDAKPAVVRETTDSDGDPYFRTALTIGYPFGETITIAEGSRVHCETVRDRFNAL
jgi:hypothetical protein